MVEVERNEPADTGEFIPSSNIIHLIILSRAIYNRRLHPWGMLDCVPEAKRGQKCITVTVIYAYLYI